MSTITQYGEIRQQPDTVRENELTELRADLERTGAGRFRGIDYRLIPHGETDQPALERTIDGEREIIVGYRSEPFRSFGEAMSYAAFDARQRAAELETGDIARPYTIHVEIDGATVETLIGAESLTTERAIVHACEQIDRFPHVHAHVRYCGQYLAECKTTMHGKALVEFHGGDGLVWTYRYDRDQRRLILAPDLHFDRAV